MNITKAKKELNKASEAMKDHAGAVKTVVTIEKALEIVNQIEVE